ncbi:MAG TPA: hypothetical protein VFY05_13150 [Candidatus Angelobacter sp.]|nr:hypothetical protein [Candidatus Angelobacter sp.]
MLRLSRKHGLVIIVVAVLLFAAPVARAGVADIISLLSSITSTIKDGIAVALNGIETIQTTEKQLQQQVLWPISAIDQARASVAQVRSQYSSLAQQVHSLRTSSATLQNPQQLESFVRNGQTGNLGQISSAFRDVYQPLPQPGQASPATRTVMDLDDAFAAGSLKASVVSDQASERMLGVADSLEQQTATTAPGSASMLSAQALAANLQSQAFLQRMLAAELRQEAARMAHANMLVKESNAAARELNLRMQQVLNKR